MARLTQADFLLKAIERNPHLNYEKAFYQGTREQVKIICKVCSTEAMVWANHIMDREWKCPTCQGKRENVKLYLIEITETDGVAYRVGYTEQEVHQIFGIEDLRKINILSSNEVAREDAKDMIEYLKKKFEQYLIKSSLKRVGTDFSINPLENLQ